LRASQAAASYPPQSPSASCLSAAMYAMERLPLVSEDPENGDLMEVIDDMEEITEVKQPKRFRSVWRTAAALLVIGAVASVVVVGPIDNPMHADMGIGNLQENWSFSNAFDYVKEQATTAGAYVKEQATPALTWAHAEASEHVGHMKAFLDENISPETKKWLDGAIASIKAAPAWAQEKALGQFCNLQTQIAQVKARLRDKMVKDWSDPSSACGKNFQSKECLDDCVSDACHYVPEMTPSAGESTVGFNLADITGAPKNLCRVTFTQIMENIQRHFQAQKGTIKGQQDINSDTLLRTSIDTQMGEVDTEMDKVCSNKKNR